MNSNQVAEFVDLLNHPNYEILNIYPFTIRKKDNHYIIKESLSKGYVRVCLNGRSYRKHVLIAKQFLPNPNNYTEIDHIDRDKTNYHLENLRWISHSDNLKNRGSSGGINYEFVDEIDSDAMVVSQYGDNELENYYFYNNIFYFYNGIQYRKLRILEDRNGCKSVSAITKDNKKIKIYYSKFKRDNGMI